MKIYELIKFYKSKELGFYFSLAGLITLGVLNTITTINCFSWLSLNYALVYYLFAIIRIILRLQKNNRHIYIIGALSFIVIAAPLIASMVLTILEREKPVYYFYWVIYAYSLYGTVKIVVAIKNYFKKDKTDYDSVLSILNLVSALFTIELLEFSLISTFGQEDKLLLLQLSFQGFIVVFVFYCIIHLLCIYIKKNKQM